MRRRLLLLGIACLGAHGCGYALVGRGVMIDPSIKRIGVPLFKDLTGKPGLDQKVTQQVVEELLKRGRFDVVTEDTGVDALVIGELIGYQVVPVGFSGTIAPADPTQTQTQASRYMIRLTARITYTKVGEKEPIWVNDAFSFGDEYDVGDATTFFDREGQAIDRLVISFARSLVSAMLEAF